MTKFRKPIKILAVILIVLFGLYLFLIAPRMINRPDMSAFDGAFIAHRGYFDNEKGIPENSLPSFEAAIEKGFAIELDIQLSSDGVAMVFHDADLDRVCGVKGKIWDYTAAELKEMKLFGTEQTIPTFEETLALIDGRVPLLVEYKMDRVDTAVCAAGQALLDEYARCRDVTVFTRSLSRPISPTPRNESDSSIERSLPISAGRSTSSTRHGCMPQKRNSLPFSKAKVSPPL